MIFIHRANTNHNTCVLKNVFSSSSGVSVCQLITECMFSSLCLCRPCGESHELVEMDICVSLILLATVHLGVKFFVPFIRSLFYVMISISLAFIPLLHRSALQSLHKACEVARCHNYFPGSLFLTWVSYYQSRVSSDQTRINEWNTMQDVQSHRADSPVLFSDA